MVRTKYIVALLLWVVVLLCLCHKTESSAIKKWHAHLQKKPFTTSPHISATFRTVPYKSPRKRNSHPHKRPPNALRMRSSDFHLQDPVPTPTYYLAAGYPRWPATVRKFELPNLLTSSPFSAPSLRRADALADIAATTFVDWSAALSNGIFNADVSNVFTDNDLRSSGPLILNDPFLREYTPFNPKDSDVFNDSFNFKRRSFDEVLFL